MNKKYHISLFIFRRDLRLIDNNSLIKALQESSLVIPCFIFDPEQISEKNSYKSDNAIQFMLESLDDLEQTFTSMHKKLYRFYGNPKEIIASLIKKISINAIYVNKDYTPFSVNRDKALAEICLKNSIDFIACNDLLLNNPEQIKKKDGNPYTVFTPFFKESLKRKIVQPNTIILSNFFHEQIAPTELETTLCSLQLSPQKILPGGRTEGLKLLKKLTSADDYKKNKDLPFLATSQLSAHLKFGTISIREVFYQLVTQFGPQHPLIRQLYWRDFYTHIAAHFPHVFGNPFKEKYLNIPWRTDQKLFARWCEGSTGFPIVDAGMRELNETGFMHNRVRMITASFLVKDLGIHWLWGERYFATKLRDYDPALNNGNWQWIASTGCDPQPYFRIFNPWLQQKKFDADALYIKKWLPELRSLTAPIIHSLYKKTIAHYPSPIVDHKTASMTVKAWFKSKK